MTFLSGAAVLLLRGLVISAVLGLESSYTSQLSNRVTPDPATAAVAPTGKTSVSYHKPNQPALSNSSFWRGFSNTRWADALLDCHCCFDEGNVDMLCHGTVGPDGGQVSLSLASLLDDSKESNPLPVCVTAYESDEGQDNIHMEFLPLHQ